MYSVDDKTENVYGYEIISTLEESPILAAKESIIYPLLRRLLKEEYFCLAFIGHILIDPGA